MWNVVCHHSHRVNTEPAAIPSHSSHQNQRA